MRDHQRLNDNSTKTTKDRDTQIDDLKQRKTALERDIEQLKRDAAKQRDDNKKVLPKCFSV